MTSRVGLTSRSHTRPMRQVSVLLVAALAAWNGSNSIASAECDHFTPFGTPVHRSPEHDLGVRKHPSWTVICHAGQVVAFNPEHNVSDWVAYRLGRDDLLNPRFGARTRFAWIQRSPKDIELFLTTT